MNNIKRTVDEIVDSLIEIQLIDNDSFLKIKETLTRIGVASKRDKTLYQSCHILHKRGKFYIVHFKELFALDGKTTTLDTVDRDRRNSIALLLNEWGLCRLLSKISTEVIPNFKVIPYKEKHEWRLIPKYTVGKKSNVLSHN